MASYSETKRAVLLRRPENTFAHVSGVLTFCDETQRLDPRRDGSYCQRVRLRWRRGEKVSPAGVEPRRTGADLPGPKPRLDAWTFFALIQVVDGLGAQRRHHARLAVAEERLRFSRDVHDVLGRRLSSIAVLSELAATLAARGDARAVAQMQEVRAAAHDALKEARELAHGYRPVDLAHELEGARLLLRSAGIEVDLDVAVVPLGWQEAAGWVVRESVTNVLRHSTAGGVCIGFVDGVLTVVNDGARSRADDAAGPGDGAGLRGLRERLEPLGASLVAAGNDERWSVVARLPGTGPAPELPCAGPSGHGLSRPRRTRTA